MEEKSSLEKESKPKVKFTFKFGKKERKIVIILLAFLVVASLLFNFKDYFVATIVNYRPITRRALDLELEKQAGEQVLKNMVNRVLITQEAQKQGVKVTSGEIEEDLKKIEEEIKKQGMELNSFLETQKMSRLDLEQQIEVQLIVEKILGKDISVSDEEAQKYFDDNKDYFEKDAKFEDVKTDVVDQLKQQKLGEKFQAWIQELQDKAKIYQFISF